MNILITNDDGVDFPGIKILQEKLSQLGRAVIVAPEKEASGTSQAITLFSPLRVRKLNEHTYSVKGYPSDCVNLGLNGDLFSEKIDLVVSGINKGVNMGADIWYSGTVAGARHAFIHGLSGLAISCGYYEFNVHYEKVADFTLDFIKNDLPKMKPPAFVNINHPPLSKTRGIKWSCLGQRTYKDTYDLIDSQGDERSYRFKCLELDHIPQRGSDFDAYENGYISVTPLHLDATDHDQLRKISEPHLGHRLGTV